MLCFRDPGRISHSPPPPRPPHRTQGKRILVTLQCLEAAHRSTPWFGQLPQPGPGCPVPVAVPGLARPSFGNFPEDSQTAEERGWVKQAGMFLKCFKAGRDMQRQSPDVPPRTGDQVCHTDTDQKLGAPSVRQPSDSYYLPRMHLSDPPAEWTRLVRPPLPWPRLLPFRPAPSIHVERQRPFLQGSWA